MEVWQSLVYCSILERCRSEMAREFESHRFRTICEGNVSFIYRIINKINNKCYIGKTEKSVDTRFRQHIAESKRERCKNRPLYRSFNKYGVENFHIEILEETNNPEEREIYWIEKFGTFKDGYNATKGGDGKSYIDEKLIISMLIENNFNCGKVGKLLNHDFSTIKKIAVKYNIFVEVGVPKGEDHSCSVLTESDVIAIKKLHIPNKFGKHKISKLLNLPLNAVDGVLRGKSWRFVE